MEEMDIAEKVNHPQLSPQQTNIIEQDIELRVLAEKEQKNQQEIVQENVDRSRFGKLQRRRIQLKL